MDISEKKPATRMRRLLWVVLLLAGCSARPSQASRVTVDAATSTPAPQSTLSKSIAAVAGQPPTSWTSRPELGEAKPVSGLSVTLPKERFPEVVLQMQKQLPPGHIAFRAEQNFGIGGKLDTLAVVPARDPWTILRFQETNGANYNLTTEQIITQLQKWDKELGLTLIGAGMDWAEFHMQRLPADQAAFAQELYKFCPDVVDQGVGDVAALQKELADKRLLYLWWD